MSGNGLPGCHGGWHRHWGNSPPSRCALPSDVEAMAKLITTFLELRHLESPTELSQSSDSEPDGPVGQS